MIKRSVLDKFTLYTFSQQEKVSTSNFNSRVSKWKTLKVSKFKFNKGIIIPNSGGVNIFHLRDNIFWLPIHVPKTDLWVDLYSISLNFIIILVIYTTLILKKYLVWKKNYKIDTNVFKLNHNDTFCYTYM